MRKHCIGSMMALAWTLSLPMTTYAATSEIPPAVVAPNNVSGQVEKSQDSAALPEAARQKLDAQLETMIGDTGDKVPGIGVILYKNGKEVYSRFLGSRELAQDAGENLPITRDTRFRAASVSKQYTIFTLLQLAEQGKIDLDADVSTYLGFPLRNPNYPEEKITARMLASHTSSLRDGKVYSIPPAMHVQEFFVPTGHYYENGAHFAPKGEAPGKYFSYANLNYGLLGTIIEKVTGERFDTYQKHHILRQLYIEADYLPGNLSRDAFQHLGTIYQKKNPQGVWQEQGPWYGQMDEFKGRQPDPNTVALQNPYAPEVNGTYDLKDYIPGTNATMFSPQGGLRISFEELGHGLQLLMNDGEYNGKQILSPASVQMMLTPVWKYDGHNGDTYGGTILAYGLGVYPIDGKSSARVCKDQDINLIGHTGEAFGLLSGAFFRPGTKDGFVYMMNGEAIAEDDDPRSAGEFSGNYIWEEHLMNALCDALTAKS